MVAAAMILIFSVVSFLETTRAADCPNEMTQPVKQGDVVPCDGLAFDTTFAGVDNRTAFDWMRGETDGKFNINFDQLILEPTWIHVSQKASGNRREVLIAEKINGKMTYRKA